MLLQRPIIIVGTILSLNSLSYADSNVVLFDNAGERNIECYCIAMDDPATTACAPLSLNDDLTGSLENWTTSITPPPGKETDLSLACWRKKGMAGEGACCSLNDDQSDVRYFWGKVQGE